MTLAANSVPDSPERSHSLNKAEILAVLRHLSLEDILEVIEVASQLMRRALAGKQSAEPLAEAVAQMQPFYEVDSELTQWTDEDPKDIQDADYA